MTNYNGRIDEILDTLLDDYSKNRAKQAITLLVKGLVAEAKPKTMPSNLSPENYERCERVVNQYHQNLLKALEQL